jgi:hypothetical protein
MPFKHRPAVPLFWQAESFAPVHVGPPVLEDDVEVLVVEVVVPPVPPVPVDVVVPDDDVLVPPVPPVEDVVMPDDEVVVVPEDDECVVLLAPPVPVDDDDPPHPAATASGTAASNAMIKDPEEARCMKPPRRKRERPAGARPVMGVESCMTDEPHPSSRSTPQGKFCLLRMSRPEKTASPGSPAAGRARCQALPRSDRTASARMCAMT